jgi:UDP-galactopyranose mutase
MRYCIVGAGFSGAVIGRALAEAGHKVLVIDERLHVAGNCHSQRDPQTGVMTHLYGPHIFHTGDERVWDYVRRFGTMRPYRHRVQAVAGGMVYSLPVNLLTINQFFRQVMRPEETRAFVVSKTRPIPNPANFEEQALSMIGAELYEAFFRGYTRKQWGLDPAQLPASILKRLPLRFNYDDSYFAHPHQAIPERGYTELVAAILDAPNLELRLGARFEDLTEPFAHGPDHQQYGCFRHFDAHARKLQTSRQRRRQDAPGLIVKRRGHSQQPDKWPALLRSRSSNGDGPQYLPRDRRGMPNTDLSSQRKAKLGRHPARNLWRQ